MTCARLGALSQGQRQGREGSAGGRDAADTHAPDTDRRGRRRRGGDRRRSASPVPTRPCATSPSKKGFGAFANVFPIGIDAGICVLLALDLLLTWIRIPFPLLRQTAWLLTAATIAFNGAAAWPDPLGVGMHAVIPVLFVVSVEAARHAIGRIADITADKHMEGVRIIALAAGARSPPSGCGAG